MKQFDKEQLEMLRFLYESKGNKGITEDVLKGVFSGVKDDNYKNHRTALFLMGFMQNVPNWEITEKGEKEFIQLLIKSEVDKTVSFSAKSINLSVITSVVAGFVSVVTLSVLVFQYSLSKEQNVLMKRQTEVQEQQYLRSLQKELPIQKSLPQGVNSTSIRK